MSKRYLLNAVLIGAGLVLLASCDLADIAETTSTEKEPGLQTNSVEFGQARKQLDVSLTPNSIDDIFVKLSERYDGFGGAYENEEGELVLVSKQPDNVSAVRVELVSELLDLTGADDTYRGALLSKEIRIQPASFGFTDLAIYRDLIEQKLLGDIPIVLTDVDERNNVVLLGLDETANISTDHVGSKVAQLGIPLAAIAFEHMPIPQVAINMSRGWKLPNSTKVLQLTDYVRPLAGGLKIEANGGCTLGLPVWYGDAGNQTRGFLTASHCTSFVGINNNSLWSQPSSSDPIGVEFEDPPLINSCDATPYKCMTDAALIDLNSAHNNSYNTLTGHVYLTDFSSSTGPGGYAIDEALALSGPQAPLMGKDVNKVGVRTGWTAGDIVGTCVNVTVKDVRHPDGVKRNTRLPCAIRADTPVNGGDSGSSLFSVTYDPDPIGRFFGILSACHDCDPTVTSATSDGYYVAWSAITQAMNQYITLIEDQGGL